MIDLIFCLNWEAIDIHLHVDSIQLGPLLDKTINEQTEDKGGKPFRVIPSSQISSVIDQFRMCPCIMKETSPRRFSL